MNICNHEWKYTGHYRKYDGVSDWNYAKRVFVIEMLFYCSHCLETKIIELKESSFRKMVSDEYKTKLEKMFSGDSEHTNDRIKDDER